MRSAVLLSLLAAGVASPLASSPAFFWSPQAVQALASARSSPALEWDGLTSLVEGVCGPAAATPVEALVLFTFDKFTTADFTQAVQPFSQSPAGGALSTLYSAMTQSSMSASFPYSSLSGSPLADRLTDFASSANLPVTATQDVASLSQSPALSNGVCDVVVVRLPHSLAEDEETLSRVLADVNAHTHGSFVAGVLGQAPAQTHVEAAPHVHSHRVLLNGKKTYIYMTPNILSGLLVGLLMAVTALIGVCCLCNIQTPTVFCSEALPPGKEF